MIDVVAIETDIKNALSGITFVSVEAHRIREVIPITQMPALDISSSGHTMKRDAQRHYTVPVVLVIRNKGVDREDNAIQFKRFIFDICVILESLRTANIDIVSDITSNNAEGDTGDGGFVRASVISINVLKN